MMMVLFQVVKAWILVLIVIFKTVRVSSKSDLSSDQYATHSIAHLEYLSVALEEERKIFEDDPPNLETLGETLVVPHYDKLVNLDLIFNSKVSLILEDGEPGTPLAFSLETEKSPFGLPTSGSLSLYQTSSFHGWDSLNVTIHVTDASTLGSPLGVWWSLCVVALTTVAVLYHVVPLFQAASPDGDVDSEASWTKIFKCMWRINSEPRPQTQHVVAQTDHELRTTHPYVEQSQTAMSEEQTFREKLLRVWFGRDPSRRLRWPSLPTPVMVCVGVTLMAAVVCAVSSLSHNYYLKVRVPSDTHIRRIRSYSENPTISAISINSNSMALVTRVHIMDVKAMCKSDPTRCETYAICDTLQGNLNCRCKRGYFVKNRECSACSTSCPDGYYMTHQCSTHHDLVCRECTKCQGTTYQAAPCSSTQDTICIDVNFPVSNVRWDATIKEPSNSTSISISSSSNVFMEALDNVRDEMTMLFLNSNQNQMEFPFIRKSGMEISIKVSQTFLIPEYVDLDHEDEAPFFFRDIYQTNQMKERMRFLQDHYCRDVVPDHYKMVLDILPDQFTVAKMDTCHPTENAPCPEGYKEGDSYLNRNLYIKCPYSDGKPSNFSQLFQNTNLMYCSLPNTLLTETFNLEKTDTQNLNFPSEDCKKSLEICQKCLNRCTQTSTSSEDITCCRVGCFSELACKRAFSETCPKRPVECARGDVYRYSIEPNFQSLDRKFMCHLQYKKPAQLYKVSYTVKLPSIQHSFKTRYFSPEVADRGYHQKGQAGQDFIRTEHDSRTKIHEEVILTGTHFVNNTPMQFMVQPLKTPEQFNSRKNFKVRPQREESWRSSVYSTTVQFERPFLYSSVTWSRGGCDAKNFSQIYPQQPLHTAEKILVEPTVYFVHDKFEYQATPLNSAAQIKVEIKGDQSILSTFEEDIGPTTVNASSFTGSLEWLHTTRSWNITVNGTLLKCPGYLTMDVFDQFMESYFGKYDIFVKCPDPQFSFSFILPRSRSDTPNVFAVFINDTTASHKILLTMLINPTQIPVNSELIVKEHVISQFPWIPIIVILIFSGILVTIFVIAAFCISKIRKVTTNDVFKYPGVTFLKDEDRTKQEDGARMIKTPISRSVTCCLVTLYVVYALMFTFSVLLGVFYIVQGPLIGNLTIVSNTSAKIHQAVELRFHQMQEFETSEISHMYNQTRDRLRACSFHNLQEIQRISKQMQKQLDLYVNHFYLQNKTIERILTNTLEEKSKTLQEELSVFLKEYNSTLQTQFKDVLSKYHQFLRSLMRNDWLKFPEQLFISQKDVVDSNRDRDHLLGFMDWLEINQVEETLHVTEDIMKTLSSSLPKLNSNVKLSLSDDDLLVNSLEDLTNQLTSYNFHILENELNFQPSAQHQNSSSSQEKTKSHTSTASLIEKMRTILFPVFICVFLFMDFLLLLYRFTWLKQMFRKAKRGIEEKVAMDSVAGKIYFILTGVNAEKCEGPRERHFSYSDSKDPYERKNDLLHYFQGSSKGREQVLQQIYSQKRRDKPRPTSIHIVQGKAESYVLLKAIADFVYKHLISPLLWRIVLVGAFILIISLVTMTTNDLVTIETATFLMDTKSILPQLHRQIEISNALLNDFAVLSNEMLGEFQSKTFMEVNEINSLLEHTVQRHTSIVESLVQELCSIENASPCQHTQPTLSLLDTLQGCNFMPIHPQYLQEFRDVTFMEYLHTELLPLVETLRQILFNTCYILFGFACLMLISQIFMRVIIFYLLKTNRLPKVTRYLVSNANECWKASPISPHSSFYRSYSLIESCESGVVGDIDDHYRDPTTLHPTTQPHN